MPVSPITAYRNGPGIWYYSDGFVTVPYDGAQRLGWDTARAEREAIAAGRSVNTKGTGHTGSSQWVSAKEAV